MTVSADERALVRSNGAAIEPEVLEVQSLGAVAAITGAEIDRQIATAKKYPRDILRVKEGLKALVTSDKDTAASCMYRLPRGGKHIEGGSVRFAEMLAQQWQNCRVGARVVAIEDEHVVAQGFYHDLEANVAISFEVKRRITDRSGKRYDADMIGVTGNAACGVAFRNAVLKGIPKPYWVDSYNAAVEIVRGKAKDLKGNVEQAIEFTKKAASVSEVQILAALGRKKREEITQDDLVELRGMIEAMRSGESKVEDLFPPEYKAVAERDSRLRDAVYEDGEPVEGTHWFELSKEIERVYNAGKKMKPGAVFDKAKMIFEKAGIEGLRGGEGSTNFRMFALSDMVKMRQYLVEKYPPGGAAVQPVVEPQPEPEVKPAKFALGVCSYFGCQTEATVSDNGQQWCAQHAPVEAAEEPGLEEESAPALEEEESPLERGLRAQDEQDAEIFTLMPLIAAYEQKIGKTATKKDAVVKGGEPVGCFLINREIQVAHGFNKATLLYVDTEQGPEQKVDADLCRRYCRWIREQGVVL